MNGYDTTILEMNSTPGGLCTSWKRQGYLFDGSVAGLAGSAPGNPLYRLWEEIGAAKYCPLHYGEPFGYVHTGDGQIVTIYTNIEQPLNRAEKRFKRCASRMAAFLKPPKHK
jgi:phytoene dehydrogenase-like protein